MMKKFIRFCFKGLGITVLILFALDLLFTGVMQEATPRTKYQFLRQLKNKHINYIFIGSSRVDNGIVPEVIQKKTGKSSVNLGFQASKMNDLYTMLQLINAYKISYDTLYVQIDYNYNLKGYSNMMKYEIMPFIHENAATRHYAHTQLADDPLLFYMPFYRYAQNDLKIGVREFLMNCVGKKTFVTTTHGYNSLEGSHTSHSYRLPKKIAPKNPTFEAMKTYIKTHNMRVRFFCAPFCLKVNNKAYLQQLKQRIPDLIDFSSVVTNDHFFNNCAHLNDAGANYFTQFFVEHELQNSSKVE